MGFFGLQPSDKLSLHKQIFQLIYHGQGFTHSDVYDMPIYLRNFYLKELIDTRKKENQQIKKAQNKSKGVSRPAINPRFKR